MMDGTEILLSGFEPETLALLAPRSNQTELWEQKTQMGYNLHAYNESYC